jgi:hypothetical protein
VCEACFNERLAPGAFPTKLEPGQREYRGYDEWAVHPDEARFVLHRGYALVNGERQRVRFIHNEAFVTQITVEKSGSHTNIYEGIA